MQTESSRYQVKAAGREFKALSVAYAIVLASALTFTYLIFRAAHLISIYQPAIDAVSYSEAHVYVVLIEIALWTIMARSSIRFKAFTRKIVRSKDGAALNIIANAMLLSFIYAILFDMASTVKTLFIHSPYLALATTVTNLLPLGIFLILTIMLTIGVYRLQHSLPDASLRSKRFRQITILSIALFTLLVIPYVQYFYRVAPILRDDDGLHHFALSPRSLMLVYLIPFLAVWLLGLISCINLARYGARVRGMLYRPLFRDLYVGILTAYTSTYLIQIFYLSNVPSNRFGIGLLTLVGLIAMLIVGYALIYRGANRLYLLERSPS